MEITYEITPDDLFSYSKGTSKGTNIYTYNAVFMSVLVMLFLFGDILLAVVAAFKNDGSIKVDSVNILPRGIIALVIIGIYYVVVMKLSKQWFRRAAKNVTGKNGFFCEHKIVLADDGFTETTHVNRNFASWEGVENVQETASYITITLRSTSRYFIPKRAFSSTDDTRAFVDTAQRYINEANVPRQPNVD